jgi:hypothetical protein
MTGAGILPVAIHKKKLYFLFGRENKYNDTPGWSDFGGGVESGETILETNLREIEEESCGFISKEEIIESIHLNGSISYTMFSNGKKYVTTIVKIPYDEKLPIYFNKCRSTIEKHVSPKIIKTNVIFEKDKLKWFTLEEMYNDVHIFRHFYQSMIQKLIQNYKEIERFAK